MEKAGTKGANGTKKRYCTNVHSERTSNWSGEKEWNEVGTRANNNTYLKQVHKTKQYNNKYTKQTRRKCTISIQDQQIAYSLEHKEASPWNGQ